MDTALRRWHNSMLMSAFLAWREFVAYKKDRAQLCEEEEEEEEDEEEEEEEDEEEEEEEDEEEELEEMAEEKEEKEEEEEEEEEEAKVQTKKAKQAQTEKEQRGFEENKGSGKSIRGADGRGKGRAVKANRDGASAERDAPPHLPRDDVGPTENEAAVKSSGGGRGVADHARPHVLAEGTESLDGGTSGVLAELLASSPSKRSKAASQEAEPSAPGVASDDEGESDVFAPALHSPSAPNSHTSSATAVASSQQQQQQHQHQHQQCSASIEDLWYQSIGTDTEQDLRDLMVSQGTSPQFLDAATGSDQPLAKEQGTDCNGLNSSDATTECHFPLPWIFDDD